MFDEALDRVVSERMVNEGFTPAAFYKSYLSFDDTVSEPGPLDDYGNSRGLCQLVRIHSGNDLCVTDVDGTLPHFSSCHSIPSVISTEEGSTAEDSTEEGLLVDQSDILDDSIDAVANVDTSFVFGDMSPEHVPQGAAEKKDAAESALAWSALSMILGAPAPTSVKKTKKRRRPVNLWLDDGDSAVGDLDDIMLPPQDDDT